MEEGMAPAPSLSAKEKTMKLLSPENWKAIFAGFMDTAVEVGLTMLYALAIFIIGWIIIKIVLWLVRKALDRRESLEATLKNFVVSVLGFVLKLLLFTAVLSVLGVDLVALAGIIGALGIAVGLSLGDLMSNFVAGMILLTRKPFKAGDFIEAQGMKGTVETIDMFMTTLNSPDNKVISIPNLPLATDTVTNYSANSIRRVDLMVGVAYDADVEEAKKILLKICKKNKLVVSKPETTVEVHELGDNSVNFVVRPHCKKEHYWTVWWDITTAAKKKLDEAGIGIPFPQRDVHLFKGVASEAQNDGEESSSDEVVETESEEKTAKSPVVSPRDLAKKAGKAAKKASATLSKVTRRSKKEKK